MSNAEFEPVTDCGELTDEYKRLRAYQFDTSKYVVIPGDGKCSKCRRAYDSTDMGIHMSPPLTHNGQPVNLDAILDLAASIGNDLGEGFADGYCLCDENEGPAKQCFWCDVKDRIRALSPNDRAFLEARLEGG